MDSVKRRSAFRMNGGLIGSADKLVNDVRVIESRLAEFMSRLDVARDAAVIQRLAESLEEVAQFLQQADLFFSQRTSLCGTKVGLEELTPGGIAQRGVS